MEKTIAISTGPATHLDHLGVLADLFSIPLVVTDEKTFELAQLYYPELKVELKHFSDLTLDYIASVDAIMGCGKFWALELKGMLQLFYNKEMRFIFCPHGNSDKGFSLSETLSQDVALIYGDHMQELLDKTGNQRKAAIRTGNYRFPYYRKRKAFYDELFAKKIPLDKNKRTILYAPTWKSKENPISFIESCESLLSSLVDSFNLIIKLHPFLEEDHPAEVVKLISCFEHKTNVFFLLDFPPIYPILDAADIYLGDFSSIGYDFLAFDKPLFFLNQNEGKGSLAQAGISIPLSEQKEISRFIEKHAKENQSHFSVQRKQVYEYAFGKEKHPSLIWEELRQKL